MPPKHKTGSTKKQRSNNAIGYIRVSREDQNLGPKAQRTQINRWCKMHGIEVIEVIEDHGVSGGAPLDKRPGLMQAIALLRERGAGVLIVAKRDRLARDVMIAAMVERLVERSGATIVSADGAGNGSGPEQELMRGIINVFAQYERALTKSRTKAAAAAKKALGERWGSVPYGFRLSGDGKKLEPYLDEQNTLTLIKTLRDAGKSLRAIASHLNNVAAPCRGKRWYLTTVARLCDRMYQTQS